MKRFTLFSMAISGALLLNTQAFAEEVVSLPVVEEPATGQVEVPTLRQSIEEAVSKVRPALVRIHVVDTYYQEGRELKYESSGSGVVITNEGHVVTNHHVAGHAKQLKVTFADKQDFPAALVGTDPLTDIAVIKVLNGGEPLPTADFGDSDKIQVGDQVLAMGSPLALSQSVTLGIVSNAEMVMPEWMGRFGGLEQDGEDVGALVRWIGHDAAIFGGNSGGPLVDLTGQIIGINEINLGLGGAIPGNLARNVAHAIIKDGKVTRAWIGIEAQPRLQHGGVEKGVLVSGALKGSPAEKAGIKSGDVLLSVNGQAVDVEFNVQLPDFNLLMASLPIGQEIEVKLLRDGAETSLAVTPEERQPTLPKEHELKPWGITVRDISFMMAKELKRETTDGVLITSVRAGGPAGDAKPPLAQDDVLVAIGDKAITDVESLRTLTTELTEGAEDKTPMLTTYERKNQEFVTVVRVGTSEIQDPGREVKKAWLPVETQVLTRDIAEQLGKPDMNGFRVTHVYKDSNAEKAGVKVGDVIFAVDGQALTASSPEHYEELPALIRQYKTGTVTELSILREGAEQKVPVELVISPPLPREMKKYEDENFEFTVRDITFFDKAEEQWQEGQEGVLVDQVKPGGWAALGQLAVGDLILQVDGRSIPAVEVLEQTMDEISAAKKAVVVFKVLRGIHTFFIELEPKWETE